VIDSLVLFPFWQSFMIVRLATYSCSMLTDEIKSLIGELIEKYLLEKLRNAF
jgi:hypothetical protein